MKKFRGWEKVFSFTYGQNMKSKSYIAVTIIIAVIMFGLSMLLTTLSAKPEEPEEGRIIEEGEVYSWVEEAYVLDVNGNIFQSTEQIKNVLPEYDTEYFRDLTFEYVTGMNRSAYFLHKEELNRQA